LDLAPIGPRYAKEHLGYFRAARTDEAEEPQDLARPDVEADVLNKAGSSQSPDAEDRQANLRIFLGKEGPGLSANHVPNGLFRGQISGRSCDDALTGSQDRNFIAQPKDLIYKMAYEENGHPLLFQPLYDLE